MFCGHFSQNLIVLFSKEKHSFSSRREEVDLVLLSREIKERTHVFECEWVVSFSISFILMA